MKKLLYLLVMLIAVSGALAGTQYINTAGSNQSIGSSNTLFIDNTNGRVGIGTATPAQKLDVSGNIYSSGGITAEAATANIISTSPGVTAFYHTTDASGALLKVDGSWPIRFNTNSSERMRIDSSGNVGIGTNNPQTKLDIATESAVNDGIQLTKSAAGNVGAIEFKRSEGTLAAPTAVSASRALSRINTYGYDGSAYRLGTTIESRSDGAINATDWSTFLSFYTTSGTTNSEKLRITSSGNVGIGTTSPGSLLHVQGGQIQIGNASSNSGAYMKFLGSSTGRNFIIGNQQNVADAFEITPSTAVGGTTFTTPAVVVLGGGNVGIGLSNPNMKFHVAGNVAVGGLGGVTAPSNPQIYVGDSSAAGDYAIIDWDSTNNDLVIHNQGSANQLDIDSNGNVGIGTASPTVKLEVSGGDTYLQTMSIGQSGGHYQEIGYNVNFTGSNDVYNYRVTDTAASIRLGYNSGIEFRTAPSGTAGSALTLTNVMTLSRAGNLGINGNLTVSGTSGTINGNTIWHAGNDGTGSGLDADTVDGQSYNANWPTTLANIQSATTNDFHNIGGTDDDIPDSDAEVPNAITVSGGTLGSNTISSTAAWSVTDNLSIDSNTLYIDGTNNRVGIGTASPSYSLDIVGNSSLWQSNYPSDDGMVLNMPFSEGTGTTVYDKSAKGNDGTLAGTYSWSTGKYGNALNFTDGYVSTGYTPKAGAKSLSYWVYYNTVSTGDYQILGTQEGANKYFYNGIANGGQGYAYAGDTGGTYSYTFSAGQWYQVAMTMEETGGGAGTTRYYVNGVQVDSRAYTSSSDSTLNFYIGKLHGAGIAYPFNARIDEMHVYSRALSPDEIKTQYLQGMQSHGYVMADNFKIINTTANELMRVTNTGRVGINTTAPGYLEHLKGGDLFIEDTSDPKLGFGHVGNTIYASVFRESSTGKLFIRNDQGNAIILDNGSVGIGTSSPSTKLHLYEAGASDVIFRMTPANGANDAIIQMTGQGNDITAEGFRIQYDNDVGDVYLDTTYNNDASSMHFRTKANQERLTILGNGNVGIGATSPGTKLEIKQADDTTRPLRITDSSGRYTDLGYGSTYTFDINPATNDHMRIGQITAAGSAYVALFTNTQERMRIDPSGNVGVGSVNPSYKFEVNTSNALGMRVQTVTSSVGNPQIDLWDGGRSEETVISSTDGTTTGTYIASYSNHPLMFATYAGSTPTAEMTILNGNVGVGTSSPGARLDIQGPDASTSAQNILKLQTGNASYYGLIKQDAFDASDYNGSVRDMILLGVNNGWNIAGETDVKFTTYQGGWQRRMTIANNGNVGIGASSPNSKLTIGTDFASIPGITVDTGGTSDSAFITRKAASKPAFGILPWDSEVYLSAGIYYDGGSWVQHSDTNDNQLFVLNPGTGVTWYASNNGVDSWNVASAVQLWDSSGNATFPTAKINTYTDTGGTTRMSFSSGNVIVTVG